MALLVYRHAGDGYGLYLTLNAPPEGYASGVAWFPNESPASNLENTLGRLLRRLLVLSQSAEIHS